MTDDASDERTADRREELGPTIAGVAHDFNNLLSIILNYVGFVADELGDNQGARDDLEEIRRAAERAGHLTQELLTLGELETGRTVDLEVDPWPAQPSASGSEIQR